MELRNGHSISELGSLEPSHYKRHHSISFLHISQYLNDKLAVCDTAIFNVLSQNQLRNFIFCSIKGAIHINNQAPPTHQLVRHPLHAADKGFIPNRICYHGLDVDSHGLLQEDEIVLGHAEGVHVARVQLPAGIYRRHLFRLSEDAACDGEKW